MRWAPRLSSPKADATAVGYTKWNLANLPRYQQTPWRESLAFQRRVKSEDVDALLVFVHAVRSAGSGAATTLKIKANRFLTRTSRPPGRKLDVRPWISRALHPAVRSIARAAILTMCASDRRNR